MHKVHQEGLLLGCSARGCSGSVCMNIEGGGLSEQQVGGHCPTSKGPPIPPDPYDFMCCFTMQRQTDTIKFSCSVYVSCRWSPLGRDGEMAGWGMGRGGGGENQLSPLTNIDPRQTVGPFWLLFGGWGLEAVTAFTPRCHQRLCVSLCVRQRGTTMKELCNCEKMQTERKRGKGQCW